MPEDYCEDDGGGVDGGLTDENGNQIYIDMRIFAPVTMPSSYSSTHRELLRLEYNFDMWLYGESNVWPPNFLYESRDEHFSDGHIHPGNLIVYAGGAGANSTVPTGEVSSFTVRMSLGTSGNDATYGGSGSEFFYGGDGNDILYGYTGNDIIQGGAGADTMDGGDGIDMLDYRGDTAGVYIVASPREVVRG
ncbi:hypothetical protein AB4097_20965 [Microvirga sp. 2MCAF35]|uniref:calcium-binding protein n=1 Tax=Microvirga sp. 2MCAF35 TaxID=3232987 RepID=UPI003F9A39BC